ncbi:MAG: VWA domain-containing protein [Deltaproteobacteria bacterium]|nr:VWA domain-containing protein [Deltaproteobacteria bacterium]
MTTLAVWLAVAGLAHAQSMMIPKDPTLAPLAIESHRVSVKIDDQGAITTVDQVFRNPTGRALEATYVFPLPKGAAIDDFALWMNGKKVSGEVLDAGKAKRIYTDIVRRMKDPGLLEYLGNDLFRASVFPIPANGTQKVQIVYAHVAPYESGLVKYIYPLKTRGKANTTLKDFSMEVRLRGTRPIKSVYSPSHGIEVVRKSDREVVVGLEQSAVKLDRDFALYYDMSDDEVALSVLTYRPDAKEDGYFLLLATPPSELDDVEGLAKDIVFVLDSSSSMAALKMQRAKKALLYCLDHLGEDDRFNIVRFSTSVSTYADDLVPADADNIAEAKTFVENIKAQGGTAIHDALMTALKNRPAGDRPRMVVFLTDGLPTIGETSEKIIAEDVRSANKGGYRLFVFGVGSDVNTLLLDRLAKDGKGYPTYVRDDGDLETELSAFYDKIAVPVMRDVELRIPGVKTGELMPVELPDIFAGTQLTLLGRYSGHGSSRVEMSGLKGEEEVRFVDEASFPRQSDESAFIAKLWATRKVGYLLEQIRLNGENGELVDEIKRLGTEFGIVTPYTSYLVVEDDNAPTPIPMPMPMPIRRAPGEPEPEMRIDASVIAGGSARGSARSEALDKLRGFKSETGARAVDAARRVQQMKDEDRAEETLLSKTVDGRTFVLMMDGAYTDTRATGKEKILEIKAMSAAYFRLLELKPELGKFFALGGRVLVVTKDGYGIRVGDDRGRENVSDEELRRYW